MLKVSDNSENCYKSELDLFTIPPTQTAVEDGIYDTILPNSGFETNNNIEFRIPGDSVHYIDLSATELYADVEVLGATGTAPVITPKEMLAAANKPVLPVCNLLHSMFKNITVRFNTTIVEQTQDLYPYRSYLEDTLNHDHEAKNSFLVTQLYAKDTAGQFNNMAMYDETGFVTLPETLPYALAADTAATPPAVKGQWLYTAATVVDEGTKSGARKLNVAYQADTNMGANYRRKQLLKNTLLKGKFHLDTFNMNRYLLNSVDVNLQMTRSSNEFCLKYQNGADATSSTVNSSIQIKLRKIYIKIRRVRVSPSIMLDHAMQLTKTNAKYPLKKVIMKQINMSLNSVVQTLSNIHTGIMPNRIVIGLIKTASSGSGSVLMNPFEFGQYKLESLAIKISSQNVPYSTPLEFKQNTVTEAYNSLFAGLREHPNDISIDDYNQGYFILCFDLTPDLCSSEHYNILKDGNLEVVMRFTDDSDFKNVPLSLLMYMEFDNVLEISQNRNIICNYQ